MIAEEVQREVLGPSILLLGDGRAELSRVDVLTGFKAQGRGGAGIGFKGQLTVNENAAAPGPPILPLNGCNLSSDGGRLPIRPSCPPRQRRP